MKTGPEVTLISEQVGEKVYFCWDFLDILCMATLVKREPGHLKVKKFTNSQLGD